MHPEGVRKKREPCNIMASNDPNRSMWDLFYPLIFVICAFISMKGISSRNLLLVLAGILLFIILALMLKDLTAKSPFGDGNGGANPVAPMPGGGSHIPPIDKDRIGYGRDTIVPIVQDRINVLLEKMNDNTEKEFRAAFHSLYPEPDYKIVYFDPLTYRMQLMVPVDKRDYLMDNLNSQLPDFNFILFDESVFGPTYTPNDRDFANARDWYMKAIKAHQAWDVTRGVDSVIVAVVDNGFDLNHPEISGAKIVRPYNVTERGTRVYPLRDPDLAAHGTHVAATAVGYADNNEGLCGIAPECSLMPVQVADADGIMTTTSVLDGVLYAIYQGADVVNVSLGAQINPIAQMMSPADQLQIIRTQRLNEQRVWDEVFRIAADRNVTLVIAAGNDNVMSGLDPMKRNEQTLIVSAVDKNIRKAEFSNYGNYSNLPYCYSTISAPGVDIYNAAPGNSYAALQGTSMASPVVAGAVALLKSVNRDLTPTQIIEILQSTGVEVNDPVGNMIQLDKAIDAASSGVYSRGKSSKSPFGQGGERMNRRDLDNPASIYGLWKATEYLYNMDNERVDFYFSFAQNTNKMMLLEVDNGNDRYEARLSVNVENGNLTIVQLENAQNAAGRQYESYTFSCQPDSAGYLLCEASANDRNHHLNFYLEKIN